MFHVKQTKKIAMENFSKKLSGKNVRESAVWILENISAQRTAQFALNDFFQKNSLSDTDKSLLTELVYGTLRREISLRWIVSKLLPHPEKLPPQMLQRMEIATYEIFCLDRIPVHASVDTAVADIRKLFGKNLAGVANAVLRNIARMAEKEKNLTHLLQNLTQELPRTSLPNSSELSRLEIVSGVPLWILQLWSKSYGQELTEKLALAAQARPWLAIRINKKRPEWQECLKHFAPYSASPKASSFENAMQHKDEKEQENLIGFAGLCFDPNDMPREIHSDLFEAFKQGRISWQGIGSQLVLANLLSEKTANTIKNDCFTQKDEIQKEQKSCQLLLDSSYLRGSMWDACAGYGGKSLALLELGLPLQCVSDVNLARLRGLCREARRLHLTLPEIFCASASQPPFFPDRQFDTILLDAPCSGLGTLARHPDLRRLRQPDHLFGLIEMQKKLLDACWDRVKPHGRLLYITCTINPAENEEQISAFLKRNSNARLVWQYQSRPIFDGADFMYGAVLYKSTSISR